MKRISRSEIKGSPLFTSCRDAKTTGSQFADITACYGKHDKLGHLESICKNCKAQIENVAEYLKK